MTIRSLLRAMPLCVAALAAMPAAANTFVSAYVYNAVSNSPPLEFIQRLDALLPGPASVSATRASGTTFSTTDYGLQRYYASADFSHTARWLGLQSVVTSSGQSVTSAVVVNSNSGFDYRNTAPGVPEPEVWAQLLAGGAIRLRRRKIA